METALLVFLIFLIASGLNRLQGKEFFGATIRNDAGERIETLEFEVPALHAKVLFYKAGELQSSNPEISGKDFRLWYPPEEVSKKEFLKSLENANIVVGTHEASTGEFNNQIDGWPKKVFYDATRKAAMVKGVVKGSSKAEYVRKLKASKDFGASGFIDARKIELKSGMTPDGQEFDGVARDLFATHVALLPNVRDPENRIQTFNAAAIILNSGTLTHGIENVKETNREMIRGFTITYTTDSETGITSWTAKASDPELGDIKGGGGYKRFSDAVQDAQYAIKERMKIFGKWKNAIQNNNSPAGGKMAKEDEKPEGDIENAVRNVLSKMEAEKSGAARMDALEKDISSIKDSLKNSGKNADGDTPPKKDDPPANTTNADDGDVLKNARASEETIKIFADALGLNPASLKNSTVKDLAKFAGVDVADKSPIEVVQLVNAKAKELKGSDTTEGATATNAASEGSQFDALLKGVV